MDAVGHQIRFATDAFRSPAGALGAQVSAQRFGMSPRHSFSVGDWR